MPIIDLPASENEPEPLTFNVHGIILTAPARAPFGTLELLAPSADANLGVAAKSSIIPKFLRWAFGEEQITEAARLGLTDNDGLQLFQKLNEAWFGTPTRPSSASSVGGGVTGSGSMGSSPQAGTTPTGFTLAPGSVLPSQH